MTLEEAYLSRQDYQFSTNFSLKELIHSDTAVSEGIDNWPESLEICYNLGSLVINVLQPVRTQLGAPIFINSGYRSPMLNFHPSIKGVSDSEHMTGCAADIRCPVVSMKQLAILITQIIPQYNQLILEKWSLNNPSYGWVHVSYSREHNKNQTLTFNGSTYLSGLPS